jgi:hypothetical protein
MNSVLFPLTIRADSRHGGVCRDFRAAFEICRRPNTTWYAADVCLLSSTEIEFVVYDMEDWVYGGIGREIYTVTTTVTPDKTLKYVSQRAKRVADSQLQEEMRKAHTIKVSKRALKVMKAEGITLEGEADD